MTQEGIKSMSQYSDIDDFDSALEEIKIKIGIEESNLSSLSFMGDFFFLILFLLILYFLFLFILFFY